MTASRRSTSLLVLVLAGILPLLPSGSASAAVTGHQALQAASPSNSVNKSVLAGCPLGKQLTGAGAARSSAAGGQVLLDALRIEAGLTTVRVVGTEDETGYDGNWSVTAHAICSTPLPGLERVAKTSETTTSNKSVSAACPTGKKVVGAGGEVIGGAGQVVLREIRPGTTLTNVTVSGQEDGTGYTGDWNVTAYAVCANPPAGLERIVDTTATDSQAGKSAGATCPGGKGLLGLGGEIVGGAGRVSMSVAALSVPEPTVAALRAVEDEAGFAGNWSASAYAICAATSKRVFAKTVRTSPFGAAGAQVDCPAGRNVTGAGADITGGIAGGGAAVGLERLLADPDPPTSVFALAVEIGNPFQGDWSVRAYAVCATPMLGLDLVTATSASSSAANKSATVLCPVGTKVVGAGFRHGGVAGRLTLDGLVPNAALTSVTARVIENELGFTGNWTVTAQAVCATPPAGLERVAVTSELDSDPVGVTATCPAGKNVVGLGGQTNGGAGQVVLDDLRPTEGLTGVTVTGLEDFSGFATDWSLTSYAICADF